MNFEGYFAYSELCEWLDSDGQLIAAIVFGYPNEFSKIPSSTIFMLRQSIG